MIFFKFLTFFYLLSSTSHSHPLNSTRKIEEIHFPDAEDDDSKPFDDVLDPQLILAEKVDREDFKKTTKEIIENRFSNDEIDDNANDFKPLFKFSQKLANDLVTSRNTSDDFYYLSRDVELRFQSGKYFQGDLMLTKSQEKMLSGEEGVELPSRTGVAGRKFQWKFVNGFPTIFYKFWGQSRYTKKEKTMIRLAMDDIETSTCIRFVPRYREKDFILIYSGDDCSSFMGRAGGQQLVSLRKGGCFSRGIIIHELVHSIGYDHMQNHINRDEFVDIVWDNIDPDSRYNFDKVDGRKFRNFHTTYDYMSIMHYDPMAFSNNGKRTIVPKDEKYRNLIGQRIGLSLGDVERINNMYEC